MIVIASIETLKEYAQNLRSNAFESMQISYNAKNYYASNFAFSLYNGLYNEAIMEKTTDIRQILLPADIYPTQMNNLDFVNLIRASRDLYQATVDVYENILILIDNLTITTNAQVDTYWTSLMASYVKTRTVAPINAALKTAIDAIGTVGNINTTRPYTKRSPAAFNVSYTASTTRDAYVLAVIKSSLTVVQNTKVEFQVDYGSGFITLAVIANDIGLLIPGRTDTLAVKVPANCPYKIISSGTGINTLVSIQELID